MAPSSEGARFGFGVRGSMRETDSTTGFGGGGGGGSTTGLVTADFFAVIGVKAERVAAGFGGAAFTGTGGGAGGSAAAGISIAGGVSITSSLALPFVALVVLADLAGGLTRVDDFAGGAVFGALRTAGAFRAVVLVVVFVGI